MCWLKVTLDRPTTSNDLKLYNDEQQTMQSQLKKKNCYIFAVVFVVVDDGDVAIVIAGRLFGLLVMHVFMGIDTNAC